MKGIILAGGNGTRLFPCTTVTSKQLLPVYDKPLIYYPLSTLMLAGIKDILIISSPEDTPRFEEILGDGKRLGISLSYQVQQKPAGIAQALIIGEKFIGTETVCLILGDNIFYGHNISNILQRASLLQKGAIIFGYWVSDPSKYGVLEFDKDGSVLSIEEKPAKPKTNFVVPGIYFYDNRAPRLSASLYPSSRGELEITDLNKIYIANNQLKMEIIGRGVAWLDAGTPDSLLEAANFIATIEKRQGLKIACIEEVAYRMGYVNLKEVRNQLSLLPQCDYKSYLEKVILSEVRSNA